MSTDKVQEDREWRAEVKKRKDFGISEELFFTGHHRAPFYKLRYYGEFEMLFHAYIHKKQNTHIAKAVQKFKQYTFNQIKEAGGALQLSKVCHFAHIISKENLSLRGVKIRIFHRIKNAGQSPLYPNKVKELFQSDKKCRGIAYLYVVPEVRIVMTEKYSFHQQQRTYSLESEMYHQTL